MTSDHDGRKLAEELEKAASSGEAVDAARVANTLREVADRLDAALAVANHLSESMDAVHRDRLMLATMVRKLTAERDSYKRELEDALLEFTD